MKLRHDLLDTNSPSGLEVVQLTDDPNVPACHVYMESPVFTSDSKNFILHRGAHPHGSDAGDPNHQYLLCNLEGDVQISELTQEVGVTAPSLTSNGRYLYYFVDQTKSKNRLTLKRVKLDGSERTTIAVCDGTLDGQECNLSHVYPLSTISSDGRRIAMSCATNEKNTGVLVFELETGATNLIFQGPRDQWRNTHIQYCHSTNPKYCRDIMIQHHHGKVANPPGPHKLIMVDIHVVRDDGTNCRAFPWGCDNIEYQQGHQCWRGSSPWAIASTITRTPSSENPERTECQLIEALPQIYDEHLGRALPNAQRNNLSRDFTNEPNKPDDRSGGPQFYHFSVDRAGQTIATDQWYPDGNPWHPSGQTLLYLAHLGNPGQDPATNFTYLLDTGVKPGRTTHPHPCISPDAKTLLFNSDESGITQAYMIRNLPQL